MQKDSVQKLKLNIEVLLRNDDASCEICEQRMRDLLESRLGVDRAHWNKEPGSPDRICIHFDPKRISVGELRHLAEQAGAELEQKYGHLLLHSRPMHAGRARLLESQIRSCPGVLGAGVSPDGVIRVEFDRQLTTEQGLIGFLDSRATLLTRGPTRTGHKSASKRPCVHGHSHTGHDHVHGGIFGEQTELIFAILSGVSLLTGWLISWTGSAAAVPQTLYAASCLLGGFYIVREAFQKIRLGQFEIDFLMIVAAMGAVILGHWSEAALLLFLFSLGHALEHYAMGQARKAIEALADLAPDTATVRRGSSLELVAVDELIPGDIVIVKPHERIATDGIVVQGNSSVDQAPITGESVPVEKWPVDSSELAAGKFTRVTSQHHVFSGTINQNGALEIQVTRRADESTLARVVKMVNEAETRKSPTQRFTDRFERVFVPAVIAGVCLLLLAFLVIDEPFSASFYRAMAVLVAASPCALAISTPSAVLSGVARAARSGVLIKGGGALEDLGQIRAIAFDKTGTLTAGDPRVTDVIPHGGVRQEELLQTAVAVERLNDHPLARAVVRDGIRRLEDLSAASILKAENLSSIVGLGVEAVIDNQIVHIGKDNLFSEIPGPAPPASLLEISAELEAAGRTTMLIRCGERYLGVLGLMDTARPEAAWTVAQLRQQKMTRMLMISGDNQIVADAIASEVGLDEAWGDLMPADKAAAIRKLRQEQEVAMVGDGVNDAPAMANATVGIAMGAAGSDGGPRDGRCCADGG